MDKNMRAGYQGKKDSMRELADKLMSQKSRDKNDRVMDGTPKEKPKDIYYSKSCANKSTMRPYKEGGRVMRNKHDEDDREKAIERVKMERAVKGGYMGSRLFKDYHNDEHNGSEEPEKFARGGIGKYRHGQMTLSGEQLGTKKVPFKNTFKC
jgi:hypothetical protein